ncbi:ROK family protein [Pantoea sp. 1.19]|uniref:ROK family protein n=1 Tax=Pantoea sp. 1.19 TaxID=1925589 RepID=UPI000948DEF9|nr:ROK family protein [Pantoea sp. 1.19]
MPESVNAAVTPASGALNVEKKIAVVDVGGTHVKVFAGAQQNESQFTSGPDMTPETFLTGLQRSLDLSAFDGISIGFPSPVSGNRILKDPVNLGAGWVDVDFAARLGRPVKLINDAAMQAVGSYQGGSMLFLGLGTGLGSALIVAGQLQPLELAHLPYRERDYEYYVGEHHRETVGDAGWHQDVLTIIDLFYRAVMPDYVVVGGGNIHHLRDLPTYVRRGDNDNAFSGGIRLWSDHL